MTAQMGQNLGLGNDQRTQSGIDITGHGASETKALTKGHAVNQRSSKERNEETKCVGQRIHSIDGSQFGLAVSLTTSTCECSQPHT